MFFNLLNFFAIFLGILKLVSGKNGFERKKKNFPPFRPFPTRLGLEWSQDDIF